MGCFFEMRGSIDVKNNKKSRKLLSQLQEMVDDHWQIDETIAGKKLTIDIDGGMECSYGTAEEICNLVVEFSDHAIGASCLTIESDASGEAEVWIGSDDDIAKAKRKGLVQDAKEALAKLTPEERATLVITEN